MNGYPAGTTPYDYGASGLSPLASSPNSKSMADAYRRDAPNGFDKDAPRFNPVGVCTRASAAEPGLPRRIRLHC
jgi:hypothetical protein